MTAPSSIYLKWSVPAIRYVVGTVVVLFLVLKCSCFILQFSPLLCFITEFWSYVITVVFHKRGRGPLCVPNIYLIFGAATGLRARFCKSKTSFNTAECFLLTFQRRFLFCLCTCVAFVVSLFAPHLSYLWCLGRAVLRYCSISWVSLIVYTLRNKNKTHRINKIPDDVLRINLFMNRTVFFKNAYTRLNYIIWIIWNKYQHRKSRTLSNINGFYVHGTYISTPKSKH